MSRTARIRLPAKRRTREQAAPAEGGKNLLAWLRLWRHQHHHGQRVLGAGRDCRILERLETWLLEEHDTPEQYLLQHADAGCTDDLCGPWRLSGTHDRYGAAAAFERESLLAWCVRIGPDTAVLQGTMAAQTLRNPRTCRMNTSPLEGLDATAFSNSRAWMSRPCLATCHRQRTHPKKPGRSAAQRPLRPNMSVRQPQSGSPSIRADVGDQIASDRLLTAL